MLLGLRRAAQSFVRNVSHKNGGQMVMGRQRDCDCLPSCWNGVARTRRRRTSFFSSLATSRFGLICWSDTASDNPGECRGGRVPATRHRDVVRRRGWICCGSQWVNDTVNPMTAFDHWGVDRNVFADRRRRATAIATCGCSADSVRLACRASGADHVVRTRGANRPQCCVKSDKGEVVLDNHN